MIRFSVVSEICDAFAEVSAICPSALWLSVHNRRGPRVRGLRVHGPHGPCGGRGGHTPRRTPGGGTPTCRQCRSPSASCRRAGARSRNLQRVAGCNVQAQLVCKQGQAKQLLCECIIVTVKHCFEYQICFI